MKIRSNEQLLDALSKGERVKYVFFWGHQNNSSTVTKSCFSQWFESPFSENDKNFKTAEHYMMHAKAELFNDSDAANRVLLAKTAGEAKAVGREVIGFEQQLWLEHRFDIVVRANLAKFRSHKGLLEFLLNTGDRLLVEASPVDKIWGIGLAQDNPKAEKPENWNGLNLLGYALMEVRARLLEEQ